MERGLEVVATLLERYPMTDGDVLLMASNSGGCNPISVGSVIQSRACGVSVIAIIGTARSLNRGIHRGESWESRRTADR